MPRSTLKRFSAFDFNSDDAHVEFAAKQMTKKYRTLPNPKRQKSPITKYAYLQRFDQKRDVRKAVTDDLFCIDIDEKNDDDDRNILGSCSVATSTTVFQELKKENLVDVISDDEGGLELKSPSYSVFHIVENEGDIQYQYSHSVDRYKIEKKSNNEAIVFPGFVFCASKVFTWWQLIFFADHIKLEDLGECRHDGPSSLEWVTDDLIRIKCQQIETGEPFFVKVRFRQTDIMGGYESGTSGIVKLKVDGSNPHWQEKVQTITLWAKKYRARWKTMLNPEIEGEGGDSMGKDSPLLYKDPFAERRSRRSLS